MGTEIYSSPVDNPGETELGHPLSTGELPPSYTVDGGVHGPNGFHWKSTCGDHWPFGAHLTGNLHAESQTGFSPVVSQLILASSSAMRRQLLENAGLVVTVSPARVDEVGMKAAMLAEQAPPRDIADTLAEAKARKVSARYPNEIVLGCDQVLAFDGTCISKPETRADARRQLMSLRGATHRLLSAAVIYQGGEPLWRHVGTARLTMRSFSDEYMEDYLARNWDSIRHSVGGYKLEEEGVRLFARIEGDYFTILGLPLLELLAFLTLRGDIQG